MNEKSSAKVSRRRRKIRRWERSRMQESDEIAEMGGVWNIEEGAEVEDENWE